LHFLVFGAIIYNLLNAENQMFSSVIFILPPLWTLLPGAAVPWPASYVPACKYPQKCWQTS